jgi:CBS domain-containing protein
MSATSDPLINFFKTVKCSNPFFPNANAVVTINKDATITEAFEKLIKHKILSIPVLDKSGEAVSIFSMLDLVNHFVNEFDEEEIKCLNTTKTYDYFFHYADLKEKKQEIASERVGQVLQKELKEIETLDPVYMVDDDSDLLDAVKILTDSKSHRVLVYNHPTGKLTGLITQSRLLEFIGTMSNCLDEAHKTIQQLNLGTRQVVSVNEKSMAISAFRLMREKRVSAVAVVNDEGVLVGNISVNDLKLVGYNLSYFTYLSRSVREYLMWISSSEIQQSPHMIRNQLLLQQQKKETDPIVVTCTKDNTLYFVIKTLNYYRVHRMYLVDESRRPIGVISIHDVLAHIMKSREKYLVSGSQ